MAGAGQYIEEMEREAYKAESEGKVETAIEIYKELGGEDYEDGIILALKNGMFQKTIELYLEDGRKKDAGDLLKDIKNNMGQRINLLEKFVYEKDPDNKRYEQSPNNTYYKN